MELLAVALLGLAVGLCLSVPAYRWLQWQQWPHHASCTVWQVDAIRAPPLATPPRPGALDLLIQGLIPHPECPVDPPPQSRLKMDQFSKEVLIQIEGFRASRQTLGRRPSGHPRKTQWRPEVLVSPLRRSSRHCGVLHSQPCGQSQGPANPGSSPGAARTPGGLAQVARVVHSVSQEGQ